MNMNDKFTDLTINYLKKRNTMSDSDERICRYAIYMIFGFITKTIGVLFLAYLFNVFIESLILLLFVSIIRTFAFGIHASSNLACWIFSILVYIIVPYLSIYIELNYLIYYILFALFGSLLIYYSPADTPKRPLINKVKRERNQILIGILILIALLTTYIITNTIILNLLLSSIIVMSLSVNPVIYKLSNTQYSNYLYYTPKKV